MADNPFYAGEGEDPTANLPDAKTFSNLRNQWDTYLQNPGATSALLSFGLSLTQPPSFGDNAFSQIGRAVGSAGETTSRREAMDIKQQEADSKAAAREAAANLAGARAGNVGLQSQIQQERATTAEQQRTDQLSMAQLKASVDLHGAYGRYQAEIQKGNAKDAADVLNKPGSPTYRPPQPIIPFEAWIASDPARRELAVRAGISVAPAAPAAPSGPVAPSGAAPAPPDPKDRAAGQKYQNAAGRDDVDGDGLGSVGWLSLVMLRYLGRWRRLQRRQLLCHLSMLELSRKS